MEFVNLDFGISVGFGIFGSTRMILAYHFLQHSLACLTSRNSPVAIAMSSEMVVRIVLTPTNWSTMTMPFAVPIIENPILSCRSSMFIVISFLKSIFRFFDLSEFSILRSEPKDCSIHS